MLITVLTILAGLAVWRWLCPSVAAVERKLEEIQRERERPEHDVERARHIAEIKSDVSRWTGTGI